MWKRWDFGAWVNQMNYPHSWCENVEGGSAFTLVPSCRRLARAGHRHLTLEGGGGWKILPPCTAPRSTRVKISGRYRARKTIAFFILLSDGTRQSCKLVREAGRLRQVSWLPQKGVSEASHPWALGTDVPRLQREWFTKNTCGPTKKCLGKNTSL